VARPGFYNENRNRAFPFLLGTVNSQVLGPATLRHLPNSVVVDAGFIVGNNAGFITDVNKIYLARVRRTGSAFRFEFGSDAANLVGTKLVFVRFLGDNGYLAEHVDEWEVHLTSQSAGPCDEPLWSGYMVSGRIDDLVALLPTDGSLERQADDATVEPALIQNLAHTYVRGVSLANGDRTRVVAPEGCPPVTWPFPTGVIYPGARCIQGDILFKPGYNCSIYQDAANNGLVFRAVPGAGDGQPCVETPVFAGEQPPNDSSLYAGGPTCNETLRSINGQGGPNFTITPGQGVSIQPDPDNNTLVIDVSMVGLQSCNGVSQVSESI